MSSANEAVSSLFDPKFSATPQVQPKVKVQQLKQQKKDEEEKVKAAEGKHQRKKRKRREAEAAAPPGKQKVTKEKVRSKASMEQDAERNERTIFIGGLPVEDTSKKALKKLLQTVDCKADAIRFRSISFANPEKSKKAQWQKKELNPNSKTMNAYAVLKHVNQVELALKLNGHEFTPGYIIRVDKAGTPSMSTKTSVFVGNLPFDIQQNAVHEYFSKCGEIQYVRLIRDSATGLGKGFGYVAFKDAQSVAVALALHGSLLADRNIRVFRGTNKDKKQHDIRNKKKKRGNQGADTRVKKKKVKTKKNRLNAT